MSILGDVEIIDQLARLANFAADRAVIESFGQQSAIPGPDGRPQRLTSAEESAIGVRAAIAYLVSTGLVVPITRGELERRMDEGIDLDMPATLRETLRERNVRP